MTDGFPRAGKEAMNSELPNSDVHEMPMIMTRLQLAAALQCSTKHVDNLVNRRLLPVVRLGRIVRFRRDSVMRALAHLETDVLEQFPRARR